MFGAPPRGYMFEFCFLTIGDQMRNLVACVAPRGWGEVDIANLSRLVVRGEVPMAGSCCIHVCFDDFADVWNADFSVGRKAPPTTSNKHILGAQRIEAI